MRIKVALQGCNNCVKSLAARLRSNLRTVLRREEDECLLLQARAMTTVNIVTKLGLDYSGAVSAMSTLREFRC